jgi:hypothetical protein
LQQNSIEIMTKIIYNSYIMKKEVEQCHREIQIID